MTRRRTFLHTLLKRLFDIGIVCYLVLIPLVIITGGFNFSLFGMTIRASHIYTPIKILVPLIFLRLLITMELKNLLLFLFSVAIGLFGLEVGIRLWDPPIARHFQQQIHRASPALAWELNPGATGVGGFGETYHISAQGYRDYAHKREVPPGAFRIMVIGDSFTFGPSVEMENTYAAQLERALTRRGAAVEVINWGVTGYNMWQHIEVLKRKALPLHPDLVVLGVFFNDIGESPPPGYGTPGFKGYNPFARKSSGSWLERSATWNLLNNLNFQFETKYRHRRGHGYLKGIKERREHLGPKNPNRMAHKIIYGKASPEIYARFHDELRQFAEAAQKAQVPVLVAMIPDAGQLHTPDSQTLNRIVADSAAKLNLPFVDLTPALEKYPDPRTLYLFPKDPHNSPKGYRILGQRLAEAIIEYDLIPAP